MKRLLILGAGGFGRVVKETAEQLGYTGIVLLDDNRRGEHIVGALRDYTEYISCGEAYPAFGDNRMRMTWMEMLTRAGFTLPRLIHPQAYVSPGARLGAGCAVLAKAVIQTGVAAGSGVLFNCGSLTDHDAVIGDGAHLCLGSIVKAGCEIPALYKVEAGVVIDRAHPAV